MFGMVVNSLSSTPNLGKMFTGYFGLKASSLGIWCSKVVLLSHQTPMNFGVFCSRSLMKRKWLWGALEGDSVKACSVFFACLVKSKYSGT